MIFDGNLRNIAVRVPRTAPIPCSQPLTATGDTPEPYVGSRASADPDHIVVLSHGLRFGTAVPVTYSALKDGFAFKATIPFCFIKPCSDGTERASATSVAGTLLTQTGVTTISLTYEVLAFCGTVMICSEDGAFKGTALPAGTGPFGTGYIGEQTWKMSCCPDRTWRAGVGSA